MKTTSFKVSLEFNEYNQKLMKKFEKLAGNDEKMVIGTIGDSLIVLDSINEELELTVDLCYASSESIDLTKDWKKLEKLVKKNIRNIIKKGAKHIPDIIGIEFEVTEN
jgi:ATP-dependent protease HslVU (ClpYQ) peptidase subunit